LIQYKMDQLPAATFVWLPRLEKSELWRFLKHASLCVQVPSTDGSAVTALEAMYLHCPLLLGPADYDHDLFSQIPRTTLNAAEISSKILALLTDSAMSFPSDEQMEAATDEILQSEIMVKELLCLIDSMNH
jgi:hypothetical protein